jgi:hypothetical protein
MDFVKTYFAFSYAFAAKGCRTHLNSDGNIEISIGFSEVLRDYDQNQTDTNYNTFLCIIHFTASH